MEGQGSSSVIEALPGDAGNETELESGPDWASGYDPSIDDSVYGSLTPSVAGHVWEYGRRYHHFKHGRYPFPNDDAEYHREALKHIMLKEMMESRLFLAPIGDHPQKIADLGTGFGDWAIEVGEAFPSAEVLGIDLSPVQSVWCPPNVQFLVDDIEDEWRHGSDFDFIHLRCVGLVMRDLPNLLANIFENLKPGGWIEFQDVTCQVRSDDNSIPADYPIRTFYAHVNGALKSKYGFDIHYVDQLPAQLDKGGFVNVQRKILHLPIGEWPRDQHLRTVGAYFREVISDTMQALATRPLVEAGVEQTDIDELVNACRQVMCDRQYHAYMPFHSVWAQKPLM